MLAWLGRFGILFAIVAPIAIIELCGLHVWVLTYGERPCICAVNDVLEGPPPSDPFEMRLLPPWYLAPAFAVVRAITFELGPINTKVMGLLVLAAMLLAPIVLSFFNWSKTPAPARFSLLALWPILIGLWWIGWQYPDDALISVSLMLIGAYFALFFIVFPLLARRR